MSRLILADQSLPLGEPSYNGPIFVRVGEQYFRPARGSQAEAQWNAMPDKARAKFEARFELILHASGPLDETKVRYFEDGICEAKIIKPNPGWRAYFFREGDARVVTQIIRKPKDRKVPAQIEAARRTRRVHVEAGTDE